MQQDSLYREIILEHWKNPLNYGVIEDADIDVTNYNPLCGDEIRITAEIKNKKIIDIKFVSEGCAISKASTSIFTEFVKGKEIEKAKKISSTDLINELGVKLTPARMKCALLGYSILQENIKSF